MNAMRKNMWTTGALALLVGAGAANAGIIFPYDPDGLGPLTVSAPAPAFPPNLLGGLDWSVGNALSVFDVPLSSRPGGLPIVGDTLTTYYQAKLTRFQDNSPSSTSTLFTGPGGIPSGVIGNVNGGGTFPHDFEWTVVAKFREVVTGSTAAEIDLAILNDPVNYFRIFYDGPSAAINGGVAGALANDSAGTGFHDGKLILEARNGSGSGDFRQTPAGVTAFLDSFLYGGTNPSQPFDDIDPGTAGDQRYETLVGSGDFTAQADITYFDPNFFSFPAIAPGMFRIASHDTDQELPYDNVDPSVQFWDDVAFIDGQFGAGPDEYKLAAVNLIHALGALGGGPSNATQFEADADSSFDVIADVPEPATAAMGLMGLLGLAFGGRRSRKA